MEYEAIPILLFGLGGLALVLVPFLDRGLVKRGRSPGFTVVGVLVVVYIVAMTAWGYHSWVPVWVVLATLALIGVFAFVVRHEGAEGEEEPR